MSGYGVSCIYEIMITFKFSCKISHIQDTLQKISRVYLHSYHFTLQHYFYTGMQAYIQLKHLKEGNFGKSIYTNDRKL